LGTLRRLCAWSGGEIPYVTASFNPITFTFAAIPVGSSVTSEMSRLQLCGCKAALRLGSAGAAIGNPVARPPARRGAPLRTRVAGEGCPSAEVPEAAAPSGCVCGVRGSVGDGMHGRGMRPEQGSLHGTPSTPPPKGSMAPQRVKMSLESPA
jgi:hypothetical protein